MKAFNCWPPQKECRNSREKIDDFLSNDSSKVSSHRRLLFLCELSSSLLLFFFLYIISLCHSSNTTWRSDAYEWNFEISKKEIFHKTHKKQSRKLTALLNEIYFVAIFTPFDRNSSFLMMTWWLLWLNDIEHRRRRQVLALRLDLFKWKRHIWGERMAQSTSEYWMKQNAAPTKDSSPVCYGLSFTYVHCAGTGYRMLARANEPCCGNMNAMCWRNCHYTSYLPR